MKHNSKPSPARRRQLAMARILTNIRQLLELDPSDITADLIEQHTTLLQAMYRHHLAASAAETPEAAEVTAATEPTEATEAAKITAPSEPSDPTQPSDPAQPAGPADSAEAPEVNNSSTPESYATTAHVRIPRKLKKKLRKLPEGHPLRRRYLCVFNVD